VKKGEKKTCKNLKKCYIKNMENKVEVDWFEKAVEEFGADVVDEWCWECDCFEPEWFDVLQLDSAGRGVKTS
jgi:hypothetical protein